MSLGNGEFTLEYLPAAANRAEGIAGDDVAGRASRVDGAAASADFLGQRFRDALVNCIWRLGLICEFRCRGERQEHERQPDDCSASR